MNLKIAQAFFGIFAMSEAVWTFQTFDDHASKRPHLISVRAGDITTHYPDLEQLNRDGAGIFVTINLQTDPKKRSKANTARVIALFVDMDGNALPETWALQPSIVIESSPGRYHVYWIVGDIPLEEFEPLQKALAAIFGGDPKVHDLPRVMRVPGFLHQKGEPFLTRIVSHLEVGHEYTRAEMLAAYPDLEKALTPVAARTSMPAARSVGNHDTSHYVRAALENECRAVETAPEGSRNDQLNKSAFALGQLVGGGELTETEVVSNLEASARTAGLSDGEARETIASGLGAGKLQPRTVPPSEYATNGQAKIKHDPSSPQTSNQPKKRNARGMGFTDYRDLYLENLVETGTRIAHLEKNDSWWVYSGGVYKQVLEATLMRWLDKALEEYDLSNAQLQNILAKLARVDTIHRDEDELKPHQLNVANGILNLVTLELETHNPDFFSTIQTNAVWDEQADPLVFKNFLEFAIPNQKERYLIQQYFGYCLTGWTKYQVALFLIGTGRTGKGTLSRVLQALLGGETQHSYSTGVSFEALEASGHQLPSLVGKRLAVVSELNRSINWLVFKRITGEDIVPIDQKYKEVYTTRLICKLLLLANTMPYLGEDTTNSSIVRRLLTIQMDRVPETPDTTLESRLTEPKELSGVLRWSVAGLHSLEKDQSFYEPQNSMNAEMVEQSNRVITWLEECCHKASGNQISANDAFSNYRTWCANTNHRAVSSTRFKPDLIAAGRHLNWDIDTGRNSSGRFYSGISLRVRFI